MKKENSRCLYVHCFAHRLKLCIQDVVRKCSHTSNCIEFILQLKSVRVHFAYGRIALTLELLGRFGQFLGEDDRLSPPVLLIPFSRLLGL